MCSPAPDFKPRQPPSQVTVRHGTPVMYPHVLNAALSGTGAARPEENSMLGDRPGRLFAERAMPGDGGVNAVLRKAGREGVDVV